MLVIAMLLVGTAAQIRDPRGHPPQGPAESGPSPSPPALAPPPDLPAGAGPRATSGDGGAARYDEVGYVDLTGSDHAPAIVSGALPAGSFVEVTALANGKTILARVAPGAVGQGRLAGISPGAAAALGLAGGDAVRIRRVMPVPGDEVALRNGNAAANRADAPPVLLVALRHKLQGPPSVPPVPERPGPAPGIAAVRAIDAPRRGEARPAPPRVAAGHFYIQIAALSNRQRAGALARSVDGHVLAGGTLFRVRLGPYPSAAAAQRARDGVVRRGYGDARVTHDE